MNKLDLVLLAALGLAFWRGYRQGMLVTLGGLGGYAAGILLALTYARPLSSSLDQRLGMTTRLAEAVAGWLPSLPATGAGLPPFLQEKLALPGIAGLQADMAANLAGLIWRGLLFLLLVLAGVVAIRFLARLLTRGMGRGLVGSANRLGGGLLGLGTGWLLLGLLAGLLAPLTVLGGPLASFQVLFYDSRLGPALLSTFGLMGAWIYRVI